MTRLAAGSSSPALLSTGAREPAPGVLQVRMRFVKAGSVRWHSTAAAGLNVVDTGSPALP